MTLPFITHLTGHFAEDAIQTRWNDRPFSPPEPVAQLIAHTWSTALRDASVNGRALFPGPMTRLQAWTSSGGTLTFNLGPTDYRDFTGTNLLHPEVADRFGPEALANPLGVSIAVITADDHLVVQQRSQHVFEYPGYFHVCGGNVEPIDVASPDAPGIRATVLREMEEELEVTPDQIGPITALGLISNRTIRKPDLLTVTTITRTAADLAHIQNPEYSRLIFLPDAATLTQFLLDGSLTTSPAGVACLLAVGTYRYGTRWSATITASVEQMFAGEP